MITPRIPSEPISIRSGLGPAPEPGSRRLSIIARRRDGADRLDQVVDVRVERREVPAGAGRDPAAERRELERLREVAQRQAVLAQLVLEARAGRAGLDPRRARVRSTSSTRSSRRRSIVDRAGVAVADRGLDAADDAGPAAVRDRRRAAPRRTSRAPRPTSRLVARERDHVAARGRSGRGRRARRRGRPCRTRATRGRTARSSRSSASDGRRLEARRRQLDVLERRPAARRRPRRSRDAPGCPPPPPAARSGDGCSSSYPQPQKLRRGGALPAPTTSARPASGARTRRPRWDGCLVLLLLARAPPRSRGTA